MSIEKNKLKNIIEAALMAIAKPMTIEQLMALFVEGERPSNNDMKEALAELIQESAERGVELKEIASGYRYQAKQEYSEWLSRLWEERPAKYSRAALETLALIAYRQPVTRAEIEDVRGVGVSSSIIKTMIEREWIRVVGHRDVPGRPALYATTKQFLDYFNMKSLDELPSLAEIKDLEDLNPELDLPNPDDEREPGSDSSADNEDGSGSQSSNVEKELDEQDLASGIEPEDTDLHRQTDVFSQLEVENSENNDGVAEAEGDNSEAIIAEEASSETSEEFIDELSDVHTESINDSFYAEETVDADEGESSAQEHEEQELEPENNQP